MGGGAGVGSLAGAQSGEGPGMQSDRAWYVIVITTVPFLKLRSYLDALLPRAGSEIPSSSTFLRHYLVLAASRSAVCTLGIDLALLCVLLGAGVGLPALAASLAVSSSGGQAAATEVLMTDMYTELLQLMER